MSQDPISLSHRSQAVEMTKKVLLQQARACARPSCVTDHVRHFGALPSEVCKTIISPRLSPLKAMLALGRSCDHWCNFPPRALRSGRYWSSFPQSCSPMPVGNYTGSTDSDDSSTVVAWKQPIAWERRARYLRPTIHTARDIRRKKRLFLLFGFFSATYP